LFPTFSKTHVGENCGCVQLACFWIFNRHTKIGGKYKIRNIVAPPPHLETIYGYIIPAPPAF
jgi:hypothetical protein